MRYNCVGTVGANKNFNLLTVTIDPEIKIEGKIKPRLETVLDVCAVAKWVAHRQVLKVEISKVSVVSILQRYGGDDKGGGKFVSKQFCSR